MEYLIHLAIFFFIYAILSLSLNLVVGYTGLLASGHAAFYGIGAYTTAILSSKYSKELFGRDFEMNFFVSVIIGIIFSLIISFLIGIVLSRFSGDYYALGTLGFNVILWSVFLNWHDVTRGPLGISGISRPELFGINFSSNIYYLVLCALFFLIIYSLCRYIGDSSFGRVLKAIREDEEAISVFGYNTLNYKLTVFMISAGIAAVAGSLYSAYVTFVDPSTFIVMESIFILAMIILGGLGNLEGSIFGALFLVVLPELLRFMGFSPEIAAQMRQLVYGIILILLMLYRPRGLMGEYKL